jgi:hypothetical protein
MQLLAYQGISALPAVVPSGVAPLLVLGPAARCTGLTAAGGEDGEGIA